MPASCCPVLLDAALIAAVALQGLLTVGLGSEVLNSSSESEKLSALSSGLGERI